ncbi:CRISPR-associated helicase Cas3', partial [Candidatus Poribacteria bacterium]|nr:CRISPR-associated helicase Cas3' [Candidatus Poribacteria bacterium]
MEILGKSNQTLLGHTRDCLTVCDELLFRREPFFRNFCEKHSWSWEEVRHCIHFAVWFHDIGKASNQWQAYIKGKGKPVTHALPSFAIGAMSLDVREFEKSPKLAALFAILAHHTQMLHNGSFPEERYRHSVDIPPYLNEHFACFYTIEPDFKISQWQKPQLQFNPFCKFLDKFKTDVRNDPDLQFKVLYTLILNILTASDNCASKNEPKDSSQGSSHGRNLTRGQLLLINDKFPFYDNTPLKLLSFLPEGTDQNEMQRKIVASDSDRLILNAGCGEGKTAAALLFAQKLLKENKIERIILTLPTKFTANNLYRDLVSPDGYDIPEELVGIIHGDSEQFLTQFSDDETQVEAEDTNENVKAQEFENNFYAKPVTISTVDHLLMSLYHGYKYADRAFFNIASSLVVFDEVHYYQGRTIEAIATAMRHLTRLKVPHLVMTATIPDAIRKRFNYPEKYPFQQARAVIRDTSKLKTPFEIVKLHNTPLDEENTISPELVNLVDQNQGKRQIIFVNQVNRAKNVYLALKDQGISENLICYHSGFIGKHRVEKEKIIRSLFKGSDACVLVSTQVSELSLDISADVMYSEIAPIDSIVQRGGRLHRNGWKIDAPCGYERCRTCDPERNIDHSTYRLYLMPPYEDEKACLPYEPDILQKSWNVIGNLYTFPEACRWVNDVYQECPELMHTELSKAIHSDLIFGKKPQDNYAGEEAQEGRVVIREQNYRTYDVVPIEYEREVIN